MIRRQTALATALAVSAASVLGCTGDLKPAPCTRDASCPTGQYCDASHCKALPAGFAITAAPQLAVAGSTVKLAIGGLGGVTWSVQESGATVDADGTFHAPAAAGIFHVIATSTADAGKTAAAIVEVVSLRIGLADGAGGVAPLPSAPRVAVTAGRTGYLARLTAPTGSSFTTVQWSATGLDLATPVQSGATVDVGFSSPTPQAATLRLRLTSATGAQLDTSVAVEVAPPAIAGFQLLTPSATGLRPVVTSAMTAGKAGNKANAASGQSTFKWVAEGATIVGPDNSTSIEFTTGTGASMTITCTATNSAGDQDIQSATLSLVAPPDATFGVTTRIGGADVPMKNSSLTINKQGNIALGPAVASSYQWTISGGAEITGGLTDRALTFTSVQASGLDLTLKVTNAAGDDDVKTQIIALVAPPDATFGVTTRIGTADVPMKNSTLTVSKAGNVATGPANAASYDWGLPIGAIINGASNGRSITFTTASGSGASLSLTVTNDAGDPDTKTVPITLVAAPDATFGVTTHIGTSDVAMKNSSLTINKAGNIATGPANAAPYAWTVTGGTVPSGITNARSVTFTTPNGGLLSVTLTVVNAAGDPDTKTLPITLVVPPNAIFGVTTPIGGVDAPMQNGSLTVNKAGNIATGPDGATTWSWSLTPGTITSGTTSQSVTFTTGSGTSLSLSLTVTNAAGDSDTKTPPITLVARPDATFGVTTRIGAADVAMKNASLTVNKVGNIGTGLAGAASYSWSITGGTVPSGFTTGPTVTFTSGNGSSMSAALTITNAAGDPDTKTVPITLVAAPNATFGVTTHIGSFDIPMANSLLTVNKTGNIGTGPAGAASYSWSITGGTVPSGITNGQSVTFTTGSGASLSAALTVTNTAGDPDTKTVNVTLVAAPNATFGVTTLIGGVPVAMQNNTLSANKVGNVGTAGAGLSTYSWAISGGSIQGANNARSVVFTTGLNLPPTPLLLTCTVTNAAGDPDTKTASITLVFLPAISAFTASPTRILQGASLTLNSTFAGGAGVIDQGIGLVASGAQTPVSPVAIKTTYTLTVTNTAGDFSTATASVTWVNVFSPGPIIARSDQSISLSLPNGKVLILGSAAQGQLYDPFTGNVADTSLKGRTGSAVALLPNGKVLMAGGNGRADLTVSELYDPQTGIVEPTGALNIGRSDAAAVLLSTGKVLIVGGWQGTRPGVLTAELYDVASGTFTKTGDLLTSRIPVRAALLFNGLVIVTDGGLGTSELYDPAKGTFAQGPPTTASHLSAAVVRLPNEKVLYVRPGGSPSTVAPAEVYDPVGNRFANAGSTSTSPLRDDATATLLPNGKVLVAGGNTGVGPPNFLSSAELYDPNSNNFAPTGSLAVARFAASATLAANGKALIVSGNADASGVYNIETYDPQGIAGNGTFANPPLQMAGGARNIPSVTVLPTGKVLVAGGGPLITDLFDPGAGSFSQGSTMGQSRGWPGAALMSDGRVLIVGGTAPAGGVLDSAEIYNPNPPIGFTPLTTTMKAPRRSPIVALLPDGRVLIAGGFNGSAIPNAELFDPATSAFTTIAPLRTARTGGSAVALPDGKLLIVGGEGTGNGEISAAELFDPQTGTFTATGSLVVPRRQPAVARLPNGNVLVAGGFNNTSGYLTANEIYDFRLGTFTAAKDLNTGRYAPGATLLPNGDVLVAAGETPSGLTATAELFDALAPAFNNTGALRVPRTLATATLLPNGKVLVMGSVNTGFTTSVDLYSRE